MIGPQAPYRRVVPAALALGALLLPSARVRAFPGTGPAGAFVVFGPTDYARDPAKPRETVGSFSVLNPAATYTMYVYNGGDIGQFDKKVSSGVITLNGRSLVTPNDLSRQVAGLVVPVALEKDNTLSVELRSAPGSGLTLRIVGADTDLPTITAAVSPLPNAAGWNNSDVTVSFDCVDATSGIAFCSPPVRLTGEGAHQVVSGTATDKAGHSVSVSAAVSIDKTPPTIAAQVTPPPNAAGWHPVAATVSFVCGDGLSGIGSCSEPVVVEEGAGQTVSGTAVDRAGNPADASVTVNVDTSPPVLSAHVDPPPNGWGWSNSDVTVSFQCADAISGVASCPEPVQVTGEGAGQAVAGTATDHAGHRSDVTVLVNLDRTPPHLSLSAGEEAGEAALEIRYVHEFELVWSDRGSGARQDGSFYRPVVPAGYFAVGYYGQGDYSAPAGFVAVVKELVPEALAQPVRYEQIWNDSGSGADTDGAFWRPIPPDGHTCLGVVVTAGYAAPSVDAVRCVQSTLVAPAKTWMPIWNDESSGANRDLGTWIVAPANEDGVHLGLLAAQGYGKNGGYAPPTSGLFVLARQKVQGAEFPVNAHALEVQYGDEFELVWNDSGSGAHRDGAFFRPVPATGFSIIGHYGQGNHGPAAGRVAVVKELIPGALATPVRYEQIWNDSGSGANTDGAFWRPVPPDGYTCLGVVVTAGYSAPAVDAVRCVRTELTTPASIDRSLWDDQGSGADRDISVWHLVPDSVGGVYLGTFTGGSSYDTAPVRPVYVLREAVVAGDAWVSAATSRFEGTADDDLSGLESVECNGVPASVTDSTFLCDVALVAGANTVAMTATDRAGNTAVSSRSVTSAGDALDVEYATSFERVWDDSGSGASYDGAFYRPVAASEGFVPLGHYGQAGYGDPVGVLLVARERTARALAAPVGFEQVWTDAGSGADDDGAFWWPLAPAGYRCLGLLATGYPRGGGYAVPSLDEVRCVRKDLVAPGYVAGQIWNDERSGAHRDFGSWQIAPAAGTGLHTGAFTGQSYPSDRGYAKPTRPVWVLDRRFVAGSTELSEQEVETLIERYAPVLQLHSSDPYRPDDPVQVLDGIALSWALVLDGGAHRHEPGGMPTSAETLMSDLAYVESGIKPNPPYSNDPSFRVWLSLPWQVQNGSGSIERARPLVHARARGPFTEIQFWYFYPFNGSGRVEVCTDLSCEVNWFDTAGRHYGDWEMVSLLVENDTGNLVAAGLSQHGVVEWVQYDRLEKHTDGVRPLVYSAYHSHAHYRTAGRHNYEVARQSAIYKATLFDITDHGPLFVVGDYVLARDEPSLLPSWLGFPHRWGQVIYNLDNVEYGGIIWYEQEEWNWGPTGPPMKSEW
jgi:hypothetical protein